MQYQLWNHYLLLYLQFPSHDPRIRTTLTFVGLDSGARLTIPLTITKTNA